MALSDNKVIVRKYLEELIGEGRVDLIDTICHADVVFHDPFGELRGHSGITDTITRFRVAFPDLTYQIQRIIAEAEMVATQTLISGTHLGTFLGVSGTGRKFTFHAMQIFILNDGKIKEGWATGDVGGLFDQVGMDRPSPERPSN